jgi:hypothetical protein
VPAPDKVAWSRRIWGRVSYKGSGVSRVQGFNDDDAGIAVHRLLMPTAIAPRGQETRR